MLLCACTPVLEAPPCEGGVSVEVGVRRLLAEVDGCGSIDLAGTALAEGDVTLRLEEADGGVRPVLVAGPGGGIAHGAVLTGSWELQGADDPRWWRQGYQSWSWSGVVEVGELEQDGGLPILGGDGDALSVADETAGTSWWAGALARPDGAAMLAGALEAQQTKVWTATSADALWIGWGGRGESRTLAPGEAWALDPVVVGFGEDPWDLWAGWAVAVAEQNGAAAPDEAPPAGWATWGAHFSAIDEDVVRDNLAAAEPLEWGDGTPVFQIDDGWQVVWGDWTAGPEFPSGMAAMASEIAAAGFRPGLWMAPFYVDRSTSTWADHPDWWVRAEDGSELTYTNLGSGNYAVLDVTRPEAAQWLKEQIAARVAEGWTYLKLDFLYAGAQEGLRAEPVTGMEAYRRGLEVLREGAGPDTWILACGAPLLPTVGAVQSYRSGADIAFEAFGQPDPAYVRWQTRQTAARGWSNGVWWWNDADQVLVRDPLDDPQARGAVVANALSGGPWLLGDDLGELPAERRALALTPGAVALRGALARPIGEVPVSGIDASPVVERLLPDDAVPTMWRVGPDHLALYNGSTVLVATSAPPGTEVLTGATATAWHEVVLEPGEGQLWRLR